MNKTLTLSIVIPVYNEENYIGQCLDAIASQTIKPDEVIVVDNNSTDSTIEIARKYDFVSIIKEPRQHQAFAQAKGFNHAKSVIIGRIDADSLLPKGWVEKVKTAFADEKVVAVTGGADPYDVPAKIVGSAIFHGYNLMVGLIAGHRIIWGSNCAIRKSAWKKVKAKVLLRPDIWEDYDLAFKLAPYGTIKYIPHNLVGVSFRAVHTSFRRHVSYQFRSIRTIYYNCGPLRLFLYILLWTTIFLVYPLAALDDWLLTRREARAKRS